MQYSRVLGEETDSKTSGLEQRLSTMEQEMRALRDSIAQGNQPVSGYRPRRLSEQERADRERNAVCYHCNQTGHYQRNCTVQQQSGNEYGPPQWAMGRSNLPVPRVPPPTPGPMYPPPPPMQ